MSNDLVSMHVYQRTVEDGCQDSLSLIASLIEPGQSILDLGMGTGGLGQFLSQRSAIVADGVTLNAAEADIARAWYRRAVVADLDRDSLTDLFAGERYDCIVCADVLEHLKAPQHVLAQCKALLKPGGRLLTSVPNAGYCGLVAELMQGEFRYRPEGLLDATHLRFFTRKSLDRFFREQGWTTRSVTTTQRSLLDSEFRVAFDSLPPAVARHLLAVPDALTYQFISVLQPAATGEKARDLTSLGGTVEVPDAIPADALFSVQLHLAVQGNYDEARKLVVPGRIGDSLQTLRFDIPASALSYSRIRLDPADRPGLLRLHRFHLVVPGGQVLWAWEADGDGWMALDNLPRQQILLCPSWGLSEGALLLLYGDDPWMEFALPASCLEAVAQQGAMLEVCMGWPMSADFLQASVAMNALSLEHRKSFAALRAELDDASHTQAQLQSALAALQAQRAREQQEHEVQLQEKRTEVQARCDEVQRLSAELTATQHQSQAARQQLVNELRMAQRERTIVQGQFNQIAAYLQTIEQSNLFRVTRPVVHAKMRVDRLLGRRTNRSPMPAPQSFPLPMTTEPVDIIVPVYRGLDDTRCCLESVLAATCQTHWRLLIINDCSPEPELREWLRSFASRDSRIELLENPENLGFVGTVNRGMAVSSSSDVLLLNSDAEVANDWLDRIQRAAYSASHVASVTPFSNNATICSYPRFCEPNELPAGLDTSNLDKLFSRHLAGQTVEVPTGVGFCMYIRRACLQEVGLFDEGNFGKGYGEENDFCIRAQQAGWSNLHALDTFVRHAGGISFGSSKNARELQAMETLRRLHPRYEGDVHVFVQRDPAQRARLAIDIARIVEGGCPVILNVMHDREGGTLRHVREIARRLSTQATFLRLSPARGGVELRLEGEGEEFVHSFALPQDWPRLVQTLRQLQVSHIHYHHLLGHVAEVCELPSQLGVTHDFTAHDYYSYCPQISLTDHADRYCGEKGLEQCRQCLQRRPAPGGESIEGWRARHARLLGQARYVLAPSTDTALRIQRFVPTARVVAVPHAKLELTPSVPRAPTPRILPADKPLRVVVLGALSRIKGADLLEEVATLAARKNLPVEFHLLGFAYRNLRTQPKARLTVHGAYEDKDLQQLLQWLQPDAVWFPAVWPETYSYTLSASLESGLPIIAPNLGAFAERLQHRDWTWLCEWDWTTEQWVAFFEGIVNAHFRLGIAPGAAADVEVGDATTFEYDGDYLRSLRAPSTLSEQEFAEIHQQLAGQALNSAPGGAVTQDMKSTTLRALVRLRASPLLAPLVRAVPSHLQRRVKTWLRR